MLSLWHIEFRPPHAGFEDAPGLPYNAGIIHSSKVNGGTVKADAGDFHVINCGSYHKDIEIIFIFKRTGGRICMNFSRENDRLFSMDRKKAAVGTVAFTLYR